MLDTSARACLTARKIASDLEITSAPAMPATSQAAGEISERLGEACGGSLALLEADVISRSLAIYRTRQGKSWPDVIQSIHRTANHQSHHDES